MSDLVTAILLILNFLNWTQNWNLRIQWIGKQNSCLKIDWFWLKFNWFCSIFKQNRRFNRQRTIFWMESYTIQMVPYHQRKFVYLLGQNWIERSKHQDMSKLPFHFLYLIAYKFAYWSWSLFRYYLRLLFLIFRH